MCQCVCAIYIKRNFICFLFISLKKLFACNPLDLFLQLQNVYYTRDFIQTKHIHFICSHNKLLWCLQNIAPHDGCIFCGVFNRIKWLRSFFSCSSKNAFYQFKYTSCIQMHRESIFYLWFTLIHIHFQMDTGSKGMHTKFAWYSGQWTPFDRKSQPFDTSRREWEATVFLRFTSSHYIVASRMYFIQQF